MRCSITKLRLYFPTNSHDEQSIYSAQLRKLLLENALDAGCEFDADGYFNDSVATYHDHQCPVLSLGDQYLRRLKVTGATKSYNIFIILSHVGLKDPTFCAFCRCLEEGAIDADSRSSGQNSRHTLLPVAHDPDKLLCDKTRRIGQRCLEEVTVPMGETLSAGSSPHDNDRCTRTFMSSNSVTLRCLRNRSDSYAAIGGSRTASFSLQQAESKNLSFSFVAPVDAVQSGCNACAGWGIKMHGMLLVVWRFGSIELDDSKLTSRG